MLIDTTFDFRRDACGKDPDRVQRNPSAVPKILWSKGAAGWAAI